MKITKLPPSRWQDYKKIRLEAVENSPESFITTVAETLVTPDKEWQEKIANMFFAETDQGEIVAMAGCYSDEKEKLSHIGNIVSVYVSPAYRRTGLGKRLLQAIITDAKAKPQIKKLQLEVIISQTAACNLYTSLGFKKVGERKMAIKVGDDLFDEYLMEMVFNKKH